MNKAILFLLLPIFSYVFSLDKPQLYIVYMGEHSGTKTTEQIQGDHLSSLISIKNSEEKAQEALIYSYKNSINGFAALLTEEEAAKLPEIGNVVSVFPSNTGSWSLHTTRSWDFIGHEEGTDGLQDYKKPFRAKHGEDVIVGMLDSGIWPESRSFAENGMGPIPKQWKGICEAGDAFNSSNCNRKIIGARYYLKGYEAYYGALNTSYAYRSPRDHDGHGTHTASTVAGRLVYNVSALGGFARGTASGGAPLARLAIYKVCWPIPGPNPNLENTCFDADMLAAIDDAIGDGVHVLSISIGANGSPQMYSHDGIAIGTLHATKKNIVVACSAGNSGPTPATVSNVAPWMITVAASTIDRAFTSHVLLGNGLQIKGQTVTPYKLEKKLYPLVYAANVVLHATPNNLTSQCLPNSLDEKKVKGKIVVCMRGRGTRVSKGMEVMRAGGVAMILGNAPANGDEIAVDAHVLPAAAISSKDVLLVLSYINGSSSASKPMAMIERANTVLGSNPAPVMAAFSSRGPNSIEHNILKPDITAPGLNILAAWSESSSPTKLQDDKRSVKYNIMSGTSMSCPHVSAAAALLKSMHPKWTSAAIRSALMTTANIFNVEGLAIKNADGEEAGPLDMGSGHLRPTYALDPGLIYDAAYEDYLLFVCVSIKAQMDPTIPCLDSSPSPSNLNHPSVSVAVLINGTITVSRTVTNVGRAKAKYYVSITEPAHISVEIKPKVLRFKQVGEKKSFTITLKATANPSLSGTHVSGSYSWGDEAHFVRSPIVISLF